MPQTGRPLIMYNKKNKRNILSITALMLMGLLFTNRVVAQQQPFTYTQYMDNLTPLNPAYSLLDKAGSISTLARKQWVGIDGAPTTYLVDVDVPVESINASAGMTLLDDQFAIEHQTELNLYFAKAIQLGQNDFLSVSLNAGLRRYIANYSSLDSSDPSFRNDVRETKPNIGFGVMYFTDKYYIGLSAPELTITSLGTASVQNNNNFSNHYYLAGALLTDVSEDIKFKPATLISYSKGNPMVANISGIFYLKEIVGIGGNYSTNHELAGIFTVNVDAFHVGYSYQFGSTGNNLGGVNIPTHEVTLTYRFGHGVANSKLL